MDEMKHGVSAGSTYPLIFILTTASAAAVLVSIALSQGLLAAACLVWIYWRPRPFIIPSYMVPLCVLFGATLVSLAASLHPEVGLAPVYKFWLIAMGILTANSITSVDRARIAMKALLAVSAATSLIGIAQFAYLYARFLRTQEFTDDPTILHRITGTMGHWMTFSGEQMLIWCASVAAVLALGRKWFAPTAVIGAAIVLSFTRSVWIGSAAGLAVLLLVAPRRLLWIALLPVLIIAAIASGLIYHRVLMSFNDPDFAPDQARIAYARVGLQMIRDHPFFGVGPNRIREEFPHYYGETGLDRFYYGHLHNNFIQLAAERGLVSLAAFGWFMIALYRDLTRWLRMALDMRWTAAAALSALTAFVVAGLFEFNFGDSEILMLLLFIVSIPYGLALSDREHLKTAAHVTLSASGTS